MKLYTTLSIQQSTEVLTEVIERLHKLGYSFTSKDYIDDVLEQFTLQLDTQYTLQGVKRTEAYSMWSMLEGLTKKLVEEKLTTV